MFDNPFHHQKVARSRFSQAGSTMLFALLILGVMAAVGFVVASLVYREIGISRTFEDSLRAYYAAESGIERALDIVSTHRNEDDLLANTLTAVESYATETLPITLGQSGATYLIDSSETTNLVDSLRLPVTGGIQVELYDPDQPLTSLLSVESVQFLWNAPASCTTSSRIEVTFDEFESTSFGLSDDRVYKQVYTCGVETPPSGFDCQATSNYLTVNTNYIVQVRNLDCDLLDLTMTFYSADNAAGTAVEIPSAVTIVSTGAGDLSERSLTARTKWVPSASGLAEFVLFSLEQIVK